MIFVSKVKIDEKNEIFFISIVTLQEIDGWERKFDEKLTIKGGERHRSIHGYKLPYLL